MAEVRGQQPEQHQSGPGTTAEMDPEATMPPEKASSSGQQASMGRAGQPDEIAPSDVLFAAERLSSYYSGEVLAPIGGETLPG